MSVILITQELPDSEASPSPHCLPSADCLVLPGSPAFTLPGRCPVLCLFTALFRSLPRQGCLPPQVPVAWLGRTPFSTFFPHVFFGDLSSELLVHHTAHDPDGRACLVLRGLYLYVQAVSPRAPGPVLASLLVPTSTLVCALLLCWKYSILTGS